MFLAGFPETTCLSTQNRFCSSGLQTVATIANAIKNRQIAIGIGAGVESMSTNGMSGGINPDTLAPEVFDHPKAQLCMMPMGVTSENVAEKFGISRQQQDQMAYESHQKAHRAQKEGWSAKEITPYKTTVLDKEGKSKEVLVDRDDGVRGETTIQGLGKLKPAFKKDGTTTAGSSS